MEQEPNNLEDKSSESNSLKTWETPQLKVLSVPTKTQGGSFTDRQLADDGWYNLVNPAS